MPFLPMCVSVLVVGVPVGVPVVTVIMMILILMIVVATMLLLVCRLILVHQVVHAALCGLGRGCHPSSAGTAVVVGVGKIRF